MEENERVVVVEVYEEKERGGGGGEEEEEELLWSWGAGTEGQLGTGKLQDDHLPHLLPPLAAAAGGGPISLLSCGGAHVIALTTGGRVVTWGRGSSGQLGHGEILNCLHPKPVQLFDTFIVTHVSAGWNHSGFVTDSGCLFTCGDGSFGQLGHGDYKSHNFPVMLSYFTSKHVKQIACGMRHSLVLLKGHSGDKVYGFGSGKRGQLGISKDKTKSISLPQTTFGLEDVKIVSIHANGDHSAALSGEGKVCMLGGKHHGVLSESQRTSSVKHLSEDSKEIIVDKIPGLDGIKVLQIAAGAEHSALVTENGLVMTWGWGEHGQLGLGSTDDQTSPQVVKLDHKLPNIGSRTEVYCGSGFTFAARTIRLPSQT